MPTRRKASYLGLARTERVYPSEAGLPSRAQRAQEVGQIFPLRAAEGYALPRRAAQGPASAWQDVHAYIRQNPAHGPTPVRKYRRRRPRPTSAFGPSGFPRHGHEAEAMAELRAERGSACEACGAETELQFAHARHTGLRGMGRGRRERAHDIRTRPEEYRLLCARCHARQETALGQYITREAYHPAYEAVHG